MDTFDPTNLPDTPDIPASIVASGLSDAPLTTLVEATMQRLVASGVPIDRMNVGFRILHPLFDGMSITWTRETGSEVSYAALVDKDRDRCVCGGIGHDCGHLLHEEWITDDEAEDPGGWSVSFFPQDLAGVKAHELHQT